MDGLENIPSFLPLILLLGMMWFLMIRPQQAHQRRRREMLSQIKRGDNVVTIGGLHGTVTAVNEETIRLSIAPNVEIELNKNGIGVVKEDN